MKKTNWYLVFSLLLMLPLVSACGAKKRSADQGGQGPLKGHLVRVAHYVDLGWPQLSLILGSFWAACRAQGKLPSPKEALERAYETWKEETPCGRSW